MYGGRGHFVALLNEFCTSALNRDKKNLTTESCYEEYNQNRGAWKRSCNSVSYFCAKILQFIKAYINYTHIIICI